MSKNGLESDLRKAVHGLESKDNISIVSPELSAFNLLKDMSGIIRRASKVTNAEINHYTIDRQSHLGLMDHNAPLFTQLVSDLIN